MSKFTQFKQGDTFLMTCQYRENGAAAALPDTVRAQARTSDDALITEFTVTRLDAPNGQFQVQSDTDAWPLGMILIDVLYVYASGVKSRTPTVNLQLVQAITHD